MIMVIFDKSIDNIILHWETSGMSTKIKSENRVPSSLYILQGLARARIQKGKKRQLEMKESSYLQLCT